MVQQERVAQGICGDTITENIQSPKTHLDNCLNSGIGLGDHKRSHPTNRFHDSMTLSHLQIPAGLVLKILEK